MTNEKPFTKLLASIRRPSFVLGQFFLSSPASSSRTVCTSEVARSSSRA
jgi:hypothetical protein